jgi:putative SOS response-associated peptidase YedK
VLLNARDVPGWLDPKITEVTNLLRPYPADEMASRPVSRRVSDPNAEGPALIEPASEVQKSFFD